MNIELLSTIIYMLPTILFVSNKYFWQLSLSCSIFLVWQYSCCYVVGMNQGWTCQTTHLKKWWIGSHSSAAKRKEMMLIWLFWVAVKNATPIMKKKLQQPRQRLSRPQCCPSGFTLPRLHQIITRYGVRCRNNVN